MSPAMPGPGILGAAKDKVGIAPAPAVVLSSGGDDELKRLLTELKSTQKALVLPIFLSLALALQSFTQVLEPLKPLGWYGGIHCVSVFLFTLWQDVPDLSMARYRSQYRAHFYLLLSSAGYALCAACRTAHNELLFVLVLVFLLPVTSTWEVKDMDVSYGAPFHVYLALHYAMTCAQFRADFWDTGWKFCLVSFIFDALLVRLVHSRADMRQHLLDGTCSTFRRLLTTLCDGYCIVSSAGQVVLSDSRVADLVGAVGANGDIGPAQVDGLPFSALLEAKDSLPDRPLSEGSRIARLKTGEGVPLNVEIYTVRSSLPLEAVAPILGRKSCPTMPEPGHYLCVIRQTASQAPLEKPRGPPVLPTRLEAGNLEKLRASGARTPSAVSVASERPRLEEGTLEKLRANGNHHGGRTGSVVSAVSGVPNIVEKPRLEESALEKLRLQQGQAVHRRPSVLSEVGCSSQVGRGTVSEVGRCSVVSGLSGLSSTASDRADAASALTLANRRLQLMGSDAAAPLSRGTPMILELDLPMSEVSSVVSEVSALPSGSAPAVGSSPMNVRVRWPLATNQDRGVKVGGDDETHTTEVLSIGSPTDGHVRVQLAVRSQFLQQQKARLDSSEMELKSIRRDLEVRDELQEEQKAVLRKFQKIITREFGSSDTKEALHVMVFIFEDREEVRKQLEQMCTGLGYSCRCYSSVAAGTMALQEESGLPLRAPDGLDIPSVPAEPPAPHPLQRPDWRRRCSAPLVLIGYPLMRQLRAEWRAAGIFVVLVSRPEEIDEVARFLGASTEAELRDTLRALGISDLVELPLELAGLERLAEGARRHRFGADFLLVQQLGRGATGPVYGAKRLRDGEVFALKEVNLSKINRQPRGAKEAFKFVWKEADILSALHWPTIVPLMDTWLDSTGKITYMLMPALVGGSLFEHVERRAAAREGGDMRGEQVGEWYAQTLHGISYLHWCGVLHRDIKTDNLILDHNSRSLRIADFGSALLLPGPGPHPIRRNCIRGDVTTIRITAPEVFGKRLFYPATDLWAVGSTFYEVLALQPLLPCELPVDALFELSSSMDELPERGAAAAAAGGGGGGSGRLPADLVAAFAKLLRQGQLIAGLASELPELLRRNPMRRPTAAALCARPRVARDLRRVLEADGVLWERAARMRHLTDFDRLLSESNAAAELEPPKEALQAERQAVAETDASSGGT